MAMVMGNGVIYNLTGLQTERNGSDGAASKIPERRRSRGAAEEITRDPNGGRGAAAALKGGKPRVVCICAATAAAVLYARRSQGRTAPSSRWGLGGRRGTASLRWSNLEPDQLTPPRETMLGAAVSCVRPSLA